MTNPLTTESASQDGASSLPKTEAPETAPEGAEIDLAHGSYADSLPSANLEEFVKFEPTLYELQAAAQLYLHEEYCDDYYWAWCNSTPRPIVETLFKRSRLEAIVKAIGEQEFERAAKPVHELWRKKFAKLR